MVIRKPLHLFFIAGIAAILTSCSTAPPEEEIRPDVETPLLVPTAVLPTNTPQPDVIVETSTKPAVATSEPEMEAEMPAPTPPPTLPQNDISVIQGNPDLDYAQVIYVRAVQNSDGTWRFDTTVRHNDQGWDDYADAWQVVNPDTGQVMAERILLHPHDNEQPFTRSQSGIVIPSEVTKVIVRAKDNVEGFGGQEVIVDLAAAGNSDYFEVVR